MSGDLVVPDRAAVALLVESSHLWIVRNIGPDGSTYWTPPGGSVEPEESFFEGMRREVFEETGLWVYDRPARSIEIAFVEPVRRADRRLDVVAFRCRRWVRLAGPADPDGAIAEVACVPIGEALARIAATAPSWVYAPIARHFSGELVVPEKSRLLACAAG